MRSKIFIISGPSGSGKTTLIKKLFSRKFVRQNFIRGITMTTRMRRPGEKEGKDYVFVSSATFSFLRRHNFFLEAKRTLGNFYGSPAFFWQEAKAEKKHLLLCLDVRGGLDIKSQMPKRVVLIFIRPPSAQEQKQRLKRRRADAPAEIKKRLLLAKKEVKYAKKYKYVVVNAVLAKAVEEIENILRKEAR